MSRLFYYNFTFSLTYHYLNIHIFNIYVQFLYFPKKLNFFKDQNQIQQRKNYKKYRDFISKAKIQLIQLTSLSIIQYE